MHDSFSDFSDELSSTVNDKRNFDSQEYSWQQKSEISLEILNNKKLSFINDYQLIINCDYSNIVTKKYFSKKIVKKYNSFAYTTIIKHEKILNYTAVQIFTKLGPLAFLPISNSKTSVVFSVHNTKKKNHRKY